VSVKKGSKEIALGSLVAQPRGMPRDPRDPLSQQADQGRDDDFGYPSPQRRRGLGEKGLTCPIDLLAGKE